MPELPRALASLLHDFLPLYELPTQPTPLRLTSTNLRHSPPLAFVRHSGEEVCMSSIRS